MKWPNMVIEQACPFHEGQSHALEVRRYESKTFAWTIRIWGHDHDVDIPIDKRSTLFKIAWWCMLVALFWGPKDEA